jgi:hypothetical protein
VEHPELLAAIALVMRDDQFFSHTTAARAWGGPVPLALRDDRTVHVSTIGDAPRMRRPGVAAHRLRSSDVVDLGDRRVSGPASMWFQCASLFGPGALVALGDHLVGRSGLATVDELRGAVIPGAPSAPVARAAVARVRVGAESAMETWLRLAVVDAGFPEPELNVDVRNADGVFLGRIDLAWPELRIGLEYDGDHHRERDVFRYDQRRSNGFRVHDWLVIHATAGDIGRPAVLFEQLRQAFSARSSTPGAVSA